MKAKDKSLVQLISQTIRSMEIRRSVSPNLFRIYNELKWMENMFQISPDQKSIQQHTKHLSLYWSGHDEEEFPSLKLLRMKAFKTI